MKRDGAAALAALGVFALRALAEEVPGDPRLVDDLIVWPQPLNEIAQLQGSPHPAVGVGAMADDPVPCILQFAKSGK